MHVSTEENEEEEYEGDELEAEDDEKKEQVSVYQYLE